MFDILSKNSQKLSANNLHLSLGLLGEIIIKPLCGQAFVKTSDTINITKVYDKSLLLSLLKAFS
jgi:hypothetical protein